LFPKFGKLMPISVEPTLQPSPQTAKKPDHELHLIFVNGSSAQFVTDELVHLVLRRDPIFLLMVVALLLSLLSPPLLRGGMSSMAYAVATLFQFALFPPVFLGLVMVTATLLRRQGQARVFEPAITLLSTILVSQAGFGVATLLMGEMLQTRADLLINFTVHLAFWQGQVLLAVLFILPAMQRRRDQAASDLPQTAAPQTGLRLGRLMQDPDRIQHIETDDHYLIVHAEGEPLRVLARLSEVAEQLGQRGMTVHRSHWVAFGAFGPVTRHGRAFRMVLKSGETVPVSREKWRAVTEALAQRGLQT
jgi:DNA-binding LytR/AlgR family response regulator